MQRERMIEAVSSINDATRRKVFDLVVERGTVPKDEVADALGLPSSTAAFHLDRLVASGLLRKSSVRRTGRSGPGAGRPANLYSVADDEIAIALPPRRYDLMAEVLADAIDSAGVGEEPRMALERVARSRGREAGAAASSFQSLLVETGYRPTADGAATALLNCPFHQLTDRHRDLVCGANHAFLRGAAEASGHDPAEVVLIPEHGRCCVRIEG
jgi:predicted ArsR family transcriptional regulator